MEINGLHLLLTYQCTFECDHCFVWGSPWQQGTMTIHTISKILHQAAEAGSVEWIYFEGGEPFLYYQVMLAGVNAAIENGFKVGIVTNGYWALSEEDARLWLSPLAGKLHDLTISSDLFHYSEKTSQQSKLATKIAAEFSIPSGVICIEQPEIPAASAVGKIPSEPSSIMFRGRAVDKLAQKVQQRNTAAFTNCPYEDLRNPGRVHIDPFGNVHICQGITIGNIFSSSIKEIAENYRPDEQPVIGPLLKGGPLSLAKTYHVSFADSYADACHLCYETRKSLRGQFASLLIPDQMYGIF